MNELTTTFLVVDDHPLIREGISNSLNSLGDVSITLAGSKAEAIASITHSPPDVIILDLNLPDGNGFEVLTWVKSINPDTVVIILTFNAQPVNLRAAMIAGANAYILKSAPLSEVKAAVIQCLNSPKYFLSKNIDLVLRSTEAKLTPRELQVLTHLASSAPYLEISRALYISMPTLKSHVASIFAKLGVNSRMAATNKARAEGLV